MRLLGSIYGLHPSPKNTQTTTNLKNLYTKSNFTQFISPTFTYTISTPKHTNFNLLNKSYTYFPQYLLIRLLNEN